MDQPAATGREGPYPLVLDQKTPHHRQEEALTRELGKEPASRPHGDFTTNDLHEAHHADCSPAILGNTSKEGKLLGAIKDERTAPGPSLGNEHIENMVSLHKEGPGTRITYLTLPHPLQPRDEDVDPYEHTRLQAHTGTESATKGKAPDLQKIGSFAAARDSKPPDTSTPQHHSSKSSIPRTASPRRTQHARRCRRPI